MSVLTIVSPGRFLDGAVFGLFLMFLAGGALFLFGNFHQFIVVSEAKKLGFISTVMDKIFPMPGKKWAFNLTHTLLMSILICLLCMMHHPAQDAIEENAHLERKKRDKAEKKEGKEAKKD